MEKKKLIVLRKETDSIVDVVYKINDKLLPYSIEISLEYDDKRVYFPSERARDSRLDCMCVQQ